MALSPEQEAGLNAMLDGEAAAPAAPAEAAAPVAAATPAETAAPVADQSQVEHAIPVLDDLPPGDTFPREYVEKLRRESAGYREKAKRYNDVFDGYEAEAVDEWLHLASTLRSDPQVAAEKFAELADAIRGQFANPDGAAADKAVADAGLAPAEAASEEDRPLTRRELDTIFADREKKADLDRRVAQIDVDARTLGYEPKTEGYDELLFIAGRLPNGSIQDAHAKIQARKQATIDAYVAEMGGKPATTAPADGVPQSGETKLKTFAEANKALNEWLGAQG